MSFGHQEVRHTLHIKKKDGIIAPHTFEGSINTERDIPLSGLTEPVALFHNASAMLFLPWRSK